MTGTSQEALARALATFRRAKIDAVHVPANTDTELRIGRLHHDHRGSQEGKKVTQAHIVLLERGPLPEAAELKSPFLRKPPASVEHLSFTCDCGAREDIPFVEIRKALTCSACGKDATLTESQINQVEVAAQEVRAEALARYEAGEAEVFVERKLSTTVGGGLTSKQV